jgi:predicted  nucleic acid-binding Zn-ribbon protein
LRSQLQLLAELQHLDDRLHALRVERDDLPRQLQPYELACAKARRELTHLHDSIEETERQRRACERELDRFQTQLTKTQHKLRGVKTNKEYSAVLAEIETGKQHITGLEDQILELMELAEQHRQTSQQQEQRLQEAEGELADQEQRVARARETFGERIVAEEAKRQQLVQQLDAPLGATYQRVATLRGGQAVVLVQAGTCGGCHLTIQPQLVSEVRQQGRLVTCPHCQRILLWPAE